MIHSHLKRMKNNLTKNPFSKENQLQHEIKIKNVQIFCKKRDNYQTQKMRDNTNSKEKKTCFQFVFRKNIRNI